MTTPVEVRATLQDALLLDLVGPTGPLGNHKELLTQTPSRWYLTGFLLPTDADEDERCDPTTSNDELDHAAGVDEASALYATVASQSELPSSMGIGRFHLTGWDWNSVRAMVLDSLHLILSLRSESAVWSESCNLRMS